MPSLSSHELAAIALTLQLALVTTVILILIGTPLAAWLVRTRSKLKPVIAAIVAMPLILPPTVIGFYLLIAMGPGGPLGALTTALNLPTLAFSFPGLVIGSIIYSLPFVVHPIQNALDSVDAKLLESAAVMGASPMQRFLHVSLPLARAGFLTAIVLGFAHTVGEFGVVLMIGGNIPEQTQVVSVMLYEHVEAFDYTRANSLALLLIAFSFISLMLLYTVGQGSQKHAIRSPI